MFKYLSILLIPLSLVAGTTGEALPQLSFNDLLSIGIESNRDLQDLRLRVENLPSQRRAAYGRLFPTLSFSSNLSQSERNTFSYAAPDGQIIKLDKAIVSRSSSTQLSLNAQQTLYDGSLRSSQLRTALLEEDHLLSEERQQLLRFRRDLQKAAHRVLAAEASLEASVELLETSQDQHEIALYRLEVGAGTELETMQTELDLGRQHLSLEAAKTEILSAWDALELILGVNDLPKAQLDLPFDAFAPPWNEADLLVKALEQREDIHQAQLQVKLADEGVRAARSVFYPNLQAGLTHSRDAWATGLGEFKSVPEDYTNSAWVSLRLPLFQGFQSAAALETSRIQVRRSALGVQGLEAELRRALQEALRYLNSAYRSEEIAKKNRDLARASLAIERERYALGLSSLLSVQSSEGLWNQALSEHIAQLLSFRDGLAELEFQLGGDLELP
jgi:outer membrane protein